MNEPRMKKPADQPEDTPRATALNKSLDSNDDRAWKTLAFDVERELSATKRERDEWMEVAERFAETMVALGKAAGVPSDKSAQVMGDALLAKLASAEREAAQAREDALEEAAKVIERNEMWEPSKDNSVRRVYSRSASAIRALKSARKGRPEYGGSCGDLHKKIRIP